MRRRPLAVGLVAAVLVLGACTSPDTTAVPDTADGPYVCDGVPERGVELALGGASEATQTGSWTADGPAFSCSVTRDGGKVLVTYGDPSTFLPLEQAADQEGAEAIDADVDGSGYLFGDSKPTAMWVCGERVLAAELIDVDTEGRDPRADARALLTSMLPWACGDADAPKAG
ncbi:hypothetical protein [Cellulomonas fengjieae]|uniref:DUF3558 domain-containing protein n=1 Tax=Cellulomonas fengjieae TaxID=2819978 RepID=A0ABS3SIF1_9CELL|nr:hypothetical protein [Cellulomonas fengjieae]MBO3085525.1 hypothetical protein [Cellulomonas fengjieae]MBO3102633.1 hypothetical protein [Cellulomonas fengjieae]QVI64433.1 hypothetical protein KG102_09430 [Cellulomonas fengjieae]